MITVDRFGWCQLGNQLFQWAMLRAVALRHGLEVRLPLNEGQPKARGQNELSCFRLRYTPLEETDRSQFRQRYAEHSCGYDPNVFEQPDWTVYEGYFQSEKYFAEVAAQIRQELRFQADIEAVADREVRRFRELHPDRSLVAVHVRRGDYLKSWAIGRFRVLPPSYFQTAAELLPPGPRLYVIFSNDAKWCRRNLRFRDWAREFCQTESHWHDLAVMSRCDHFIMSPSTFSWWAAWLSTHPAKVVVTPCPWFGPSGEYDSRDIVPDRWIKLEC
jgi:hypothetical protein